MNYLIAGAGPAGVVAAETLRAQDAGAKITLLTAEAHAPYGRMAIPYYLNKQIDSAGTHLRKQDGYFDVQNITLKTGVGITAINAASKTATLSDGSQASYDKLLIATGSKPVRPPVSGMDLPGVHNCWTLDDAEAIIAKAQQGAKVVLIGAGFIGSIILDALVARGVHLTVVEAGDRLVPRMMDQTAGGLLQKWVENKGVSVNTNTKVTGVSQAGSGLQVSLDNGQNLDANLVIVAAGVAPNIEFLQGSGVTTDVGILVDQHMRTNDPHIFAAGDVAQGLDFSLGGQQVMAIQPVASDHGRVAALNMLGQAAKHPGSLSMNVLDTMGLLSYSFGRWDGANGTEVAEEVDASAFRYTKLVFEGNSLVGAISLGHQEHIGILRGLIQSRIPLKEWKERLMANPKRVAEAYVALTTIAGAA